MAAKELTLAKQICATRPGVKPALSTYRRKSAPAIVVNLNSMHSGSMREPSESEETHAFSFSKYYEDQYHGTPSTTVPSSVRSSFDTDAEDVHFNFLSFDELEHSSSSQSLPSVTSASSNASESELFVERVNWSDLLDDASMPKEASAGCLLPDPIDRPIHLDESDPSTSGNYSTSIPFDSSEYLDWGSSTRVSRVGSKAKESEKANIICEFTRSRSLDLLHNNGPFGLGAANDHFERSLSQVNITTAQSARFADMRCTLDECFLGMLALRRASCVALSDCLQLGDKLTRLAENALEAAADRSVPGAMELYSEVNDAIDTLAVFVQDNK